MDLKQTSKFSKLTSTENSNSASRVVIRTSYVFGIFSHHLGRFWQSTNSTRLILAIYISERFFSVQMDPCYVQNFDVPAINIRFPSKSCRWPITLRSCTNCLSSQWDSLFREITHSPSLGGTLRAIASKTMKRPAMVLSWGWRYSLICFLEILVWKWA